MATDKEFSPPKNPLANLSQEQIIMWRKIANDLKCLSENIKKMTEPRIDKTTIETKENLK